MTSTLPAAHSPLAADAETRGSALRRFGALVRGETKILLRNRTAVFTALVLPFFMAVAFSGLTTGEALGPLLATILLGTGLLFVVYYTMVTSLVARREQLVLKRLQAGEPTRLEILLAPAVPLWAMLAVQTGLGVALAVFALGTPVAHPWALALAIVGGSATWTALAIWSANWTRSVESAQLTTMPFMLVSLLFSGFSLPLSMLPEPLERLAHFLPMTPVVDLVSLAFSGVDTSGTVDAANAAFGAAWGMLLPLALWTLVALAEGLRGFRWDARS